jgi:hypothetical protein
MLVRGRGREGISTYFYNLGIVCNGFSHVTVRIEPPVWWVQRRTGQNNN